MILQPVTQSEEIFGLFSFWRKKQAELGQDDPMDRIIVFGVGIISSILSEIFWKGGSRWHVGLWGGLSMLLLRRIVLRFSGTSRALLCLFGALLLITLRFAMVILQCLGNRAGEKLTVDMPSFSYALYRFLLIAPAYTIIEYVEASFCM